MENNTNRIYKGLHTDNSFSDQPKDTYRFALNSVIESEHGDLGFISNEEANALCTSIPAGYTIIGKVYIGEGKTALFLVSDDNINSEIGVLDGECNYVTHVNDSAQTEKLGFKKENQIDAIYRLRRGCEQTVYFVARGTHPRYYNFNKPEDFVQAGEWSVNKFKLFKTIDIVPRINDITIGKDGAILPGSYNFAIQYLDEDLNPTEWTTTTDTTIIYNSNVDSTNFSKIRGSTNEKNFYQDFGVTNKSITLTISNLNPEYPFYRVAVIEANTGAGTVSKVSFSNEIDTKSNVYTYSGDNAAVGTQEEIQFFSNIITSAEHIEQIENRLILGKTKGKQVDFCKLQKYASKIKANLVYKEIVLNNINSIDNPKRGTVHNERVGYMPGEIYSFGIVYEFADGTTSPVYHIPGRAPTYGSSMSLNNTLATTQYTDNSNCGTSDYWGVDSQGISLNGAPVRHHRFPLRSAVAKPLFKKTSLESGEIQVKYLYLDITGIINPGETRTNIVFVVNYTILSVADSFQSSINVADYNANVDPLTGLYSVYIKVPVTSSLSPITVDSITELDDLAAEVAPYSGLVYTNYQEDLTSLIDDAVYTSEIFGIEFSDIDTPSLGVEGESIVGYYIVRNERKESDKTILDSGVLFPLLVEKAKAGGADKFVAHGHLNPNSTLIKEDVFALVHPEHKFNGREYQSTSTYLKEGEYTIDSKNISHFITQDVMPGTSYDSSANKKREKDSDGFSLHNMVRNNNVSFAVDTGVLATGTDVKETFYLDTLFSKTVEDINSNRKEIYNLSCDNKIGILQLDKALPLYGKLPYVVMQRNLSNPYADFRGLPFIKENVNSIPFTTELGNSSGTIFNGDSYISTMKYTSSMFYDIRLRSRRTKSGILNFIIAAVVIAVGILLAPFSAGTSLLAASAAIAAIGFGITQIAAGLKTEQMGRVFKELYELGLKDTVEDVDTTAIFGDNPADDEVQWVQDTVTDLWFESNVNMNWRMGTTVGLTDFMDAPEAYSQTSFESYSLEKVTTLDSTADGGRTYQGYAKAEIYDLNKDFQRRDAQKVFFHLGLEYDCCSDCNEDFPHRVHYSEQSFQEELTDNYRVFLGNNYRDLEGETGPITNIVRLQSNLFIHTTEALWHLPDSIQERVTGEIVTFIGSGNFFSIPPKKIVDDATGNSAGTEHKWSVIKTPHGVFFACENQHTIFQFDGNKLTPLVEGNFNWFKNNMTIENDKIFYQINLAKFPQRDNPSNIFGTGYISAYDSRKERILFTKKDRVIDVPSVDYTICSNNNELNVFYNYEATILAQQALGKKFNGIINCQMEFEELSTKIIQVEETVAISNTADIHVFYDVSGSFGSFEGSCLSSIDAAINDWIAIFPTTHPDWTGTLYKYQDSSEGWVNFAAQIATTTYAGQDLATKDIVVVSFVNESQPVYHDGTMNSPLDAPTTTFLTHYDAFKLLHAQYKSFKGILYPIVFGTDALTCSPSGGGNLPSSRDFLLHSLAALKGTSYTLAEVNALAVNPGFLAGEWDILKTALQGANPYPDDGLENYGWLIKTDRFASTTNGIINSTEFTNDIEGLLLGSQSVVTVNREVPTIAYSYIPSTPILSPNIINNSWTMSYNLKTKTWVSWHSYLPSIYINTPDELYSWTSGANIWKHNIQGVYQKYYGVLKPFIVEYVASSNPLSTKTWEAIKLLTEAKKYDSVYDEFVEEDLTTFNKAVFYNQRQCSGVLTLIVKDKVTAQPNYYQEQIQNNNNNTIIIDRNEQDWSMNDLRDIRTDYSKPIWDSSISSVQSEYFIDKILNTSTLDVTKDWTQVESFRGKYLVIRLIFDTFDNVKLIFNYSVENENQSFR